MEGVFRTVIRDSNDEVKLENYGVMKKFLFATTFDDLKMLQITENIMFDSLSDIIAVFQPKILIS